MTGSGSGARKLKHAKRGVQTVSEREGNRRRNKEGERKKKNSGRIAQRLPVKKEEFSKKNLDASRSC